MGRKYNKSTILALAAECEQFAHSHSRKGERRTAELLFKTSSALEGLARDIPAPPRVGEGEVEQVKAAGQS